MDLLAPASITLLANPNIGLPVLFGGVLAVYAEFCFPGRVLPGALGGVAIMLAIAFLWRLPMRWTAMCGLVISQLCYVLEAKYATKGLATSAGAILLAAGLYYLVDSSDPARRVHVATAILVGLPFEFTSSYLFSIAYKARRNKREDMADP